MLIVEENYTRHNYSRARMYRVRFRDYAGAEQALAFKCASYQSFTTKLDHLARTLRRLGFEVIGWALDA